jgi:hypothetical protein
VASTVIARSRSRVATHAALLAVLALPLASCLNAEQQRAVNVSACVAELAATVPPDSSIPEDVRELTDEDLDLAARLVTGVNACRRRGTERASP